jgi:hypothetical protein
MAGLGEPPFGAAFYRGNAVSQLTNLRAEYGTGASHSRGGGDVRGPGRLRMIEAGSASAEIGYDGPVARHQCRPEERADGDASASGKGLWADLTTAAAEHDQGRAEAIQREITQCRQQVEEIKRAGTVGAA